MGDRGPLFSKPDVILVFVAALLGLAAASAFGAYQAVNGDASPLRDFMTNLIWPGALIFAGVAAMVVFGWKANLD